MLLNQKFKYQVCSVLCNRGLGRKMTHKFMWICIVNNSVDLTAILSRMHHSAEKIMYEDFYSLFVFLISSSRRGFNNRIINHFFYLTMQKSVKSRMKNAIMPELSKKLKKLYASSFESHSFLYIHNPVSKICALNWVSNCEYFQILFASIKGSCGHKTSVHISKM